MWDWLFRRRPSPALVAEIDRMLADLESGKIRIAGDCVAPATLAPDAVVEVKCPVIGVRFEVEEADAS